MSQQLTRKNLTTALLAATLFTITGCGGIHSFDKSQVPVISVGPGVQPVISWTPQQAYQLNVYAGSQDGDGLGVLWNTRSTDYENQLSSPVTYGVPPSGSEGRSAPPLEPGQTYTVTVTRKDPKGSGDGFTNTRHRYIGKKTFIVQ